MSVFTNKLRITMTSTPSGAKAIGVAWRIEFGEDMR
jgi:hypothetical protein